MRRLVLVDPVSRAAVWSRNLAVFALIVAIFGILLARKGLDPQAALTIEGSALVLCLMAMASALVAVVVIWRTGYRGIALAVVGTVLSALLFAYPVSLSIQSRKVPPILDVSTDLKDPPGFLGTAKALAARRHAVISAEPSEVDRNLQSQYYPDLASLVIDDEAPDVAATIRKIIKRNKWEIVDEVPPTNLATGHIDVVVTSGLMGFPADLTFRLKDVGGKTQVDIRSVARNGWLERPGSNATRVQDLATELDQKNEDS